MSADKQTSASATRIFPNVVDVGANGYDAVRLARQIQPDTIIIDADIPECGGIEATRVIRSEHPKMRIVVLSLSSPPGRVLQNHPILQAGADAIVQKDKVGEELIGTLKG